MAILVAPQLATPNPVQAYQGGQTDTVVQLASQTGSIIAGTFTSGSVLSAVIWEGQNQPVLLTPSVSWFTAGSTQTGYDQWQVLCSTNVTQFSGLNPGGDYRLQILSTASAVTTVVADVQLQVIATPGSATPAPPDLAGYDFIESALSGLNLTAAQMAFIPYLASVASSAIRRFCFGRNFDMRTYTEEYDLTLDGTVMLYQKPVQQVLKIATTPDDAMYVSNNSASVQDAQIVFAYTGEYDGYGPNNQTVTGVTLNWSSNGTQNTTTVNYSSGETVGTLATAISNVGSGWTATPNGAYSEWSVLRLIGGYTGQECSQMTGTDGATLSVYSNNLSIPQSALNQRTGLVQCNLVGYGSSFDSPRWGPDFGAFAGDWGQSDGGRVLVTYTAGFLSIPMPVQLACAELVKHQLMRLRVNDLIKMENAADYGYTLRDQMIASMPDSVRQGLAQYRLHWAG